MANTDNSTYYRLSSNTGSTNNELSIMLWDAGDSLFIEGGVEAASFAAALRGDDFTIHHEHTANAWTTDHIFAYAPVDDTDASSYKTLAANEVAVITMVYLQLETMSDTIHVEVGYFSDSSPGVTSDYTAGFVDKLGFPMVAASAAAATSANHLQALTLNPPVTVPYVAGTAQSIGFMAKINDSNVDACISARGFIMKDLSLVIT